MDDLGPSADFMESLRKSVGMIMIIIMMMINMMMMMMIMIVMVMTIAGATLWNTCKNTLVILW